MFSLENPGIIIFLGSEIGSGSTSDSCTFEKFEQVRVWTRVQTLCTIGKSDSGSIFSISESDFDFHEKIVENHRNMHSFGFPIFQIGFE